MQQPWTALQPNWPCSPRIAVGSGGSSAGGGSRRPVRRGTDASGRRVGGSGAPPPPPPPPGGGGGGVGGAAAAAAANWQGGGLAGRDTAPRPARRGGGSGTSVCPHPPPAPQINIPSPGVSHELVQKLTLCPRVHSGLRLRQRVRQPGPSPAAGWWGVRRPAIPPRPPAAVGLLRPEPAAACEPWLTAAISMENPYCSCELTRVRSAAAAARRRRRGRGEAAAAAGAGPVGRRPVLRRRVDRRAVRRPVGPAPGRRGPPTTPV